MPISLLERPKTRASVVDELVKIVCHIERWKWFVDMNMGDGLIGRRDERYGRRSGEVRIWSTTERRRRDRVHSDDDEGAPQGHHEA